MRRLFIIGIPCRCLHIQGMLSNGSVLGLDLHDVWKDTYIGSFRTKGFAIGRPAWLVLRNCIPLFLLQSDGWRKS